jgi:hypothetical protein
MGGCDVGRFSFPATVGITAPGIGRFIRDLLSGSHPCFGFGLALSEQDDKEASVVGLFDRLRPRRRSAGARTSSSQDAEHLRSWAQQRRGVEAYLEPRTTVTETTLLLVAHDGEWTRRRVDGPGAGYRFARKLGIPCYEAAKVGYPQRMRDYLERQRVLRERERRRSLGD